MEYRYQIVAIDEPSRTMEVIYSKDGKPDVRVSTRIPFANESLEAVLDMYSPVPRWEQEDLPIAIPNLGVIGERKPPAPPVLTFEQKQQKKIAELSNWRKQKEGEGIEFNGSRIAADVTTQSRISSVYACLKDNILTSVDWKLEDNTFASIGLVEIEQIVRAVAIHVQECFTHEKEIKDLIMACTTEAELDAIVFP